jgi:hypothetical protein
MLAPLRFCRETRELRGCAKPAHGPKLHARLANHTGGTVTVSEAISACKDSWTASRLVS